MVPSFWAHQLATHQILVWRKPSLTLKKNHFTIRKPGCFWTFFFFQIFQQNSQYRSNPQRNFEEFYAHVTDDEHKYYFYQHHEVTFYNLCFTGLCLQGFYQRTNHQYISLAYTFTRFVYMRFLSVKLHEKYWFGNNTHTLDELNVIIESAMQHRDHYF